MIDYLLRVPFLRILLPYVAGVVLASSFPGLPGGWIMMILPLLWASAVVLFREPGFRREIAGGITLTLFFLFLGYVSTLQRNKPPGPFPSGLHVATLLEKPVLKNRSYRAETLITLVFKNDSALKVKERILVYLAESEAVDTLCAGDRIVFSRDPEEIRNRGNPYEFDYKRYIGRKGIYRQVYLKPGSWWYAGADPVFRFRVSAEKTRDFLLGIYRTNGLSGDEFEILAALTLGYKKSMDSEIRQVFAATGAAHVLAVSGLHVGIVYMIFNFLFGFLRRRKSMRLLFLALSVVMLWGFAFITGLSPSVQRSALMFTVVLAGEHLRRPANIYNTLALSAFLLMAVNPNLLFDAGFQLSYAAVLGIVYFQPMLAALWDIRNRPGKYLWGLITVSLASQITTFPLSGFYFHQFPVYFWISNFIVIPAAFLFVFLGILILVTSPVHAAAGFLARVAAFLIKLVYAGLVGIEKLPGSLIEGFGFQASSAAVAFLILFFTALFIESKKVRFLFCALCGVVLLNLSGTLTRVWYNHLKEMILYNCEEPVIHLIYGSCNYIVASRKLLEEDFPEMVVKPVALHFRLQNPVLIPLESDYEDAVLIKHGRYLFFDGEVVGVDPDGKPWDITFPPAILVADAGAGNRTEYPPGSKVVSYAVLYQAGDLKVHSVKEQGAFRHRIRQHGDLKKRNSP